MYIDKYTIKKIGTKWDGNKQKKNQILFKADSEEGMTAKCFIRFMEDLDDGLHHHTGSQCEVSITFKEND